MNMKISNIIDYVTDLVKKYGEIQQLQMQNKFRYVNAKKTANEIKIIYQVIGKSTFLTCSLNKIVTNDAFLECFSKKDVKKLTALQTQNEKNNSTAADVKLTQQEFNIQNGKTSFVLKDNEGNTSTKTAAEIFNDIELSKRLSRDEAMNISYIAGYEHSQNDQKQ